MITINIEKAKEITKQKLRRDREPLLAEQDILFQRALETGADTTDIVTEKQRLRDITNDVDAMTTESQLREKINVLVYRRTLWESILITNQERGTAKCRKNLS